MTKDAEPSKENPHGFRTTEEVVQKAIQFLELEVTDSFPAYVRLGELADYRIRPQDDGTFDLVAVDYREEQARFQANRDRGAQPFTFDLRRFEDTKTIRFSYYPGMLAGYESWVQVTSEGDMTRGRTVLS